MTTNEILNKYTTGEMTLPEANEALREAEAGFTLDPNRNVITQEEFVATTAGETPDTVNGYGLMDHGVGCLEKVHVVNGKTVGRARTRPLWTASSSPSFAVSAVLCWVG